MSKTNATHEPSPNGLGHSVGIPSARPRRNDPAILVAAITDLAKDCADWDMEDGPNADCIEGWERALRRCDICQNGYELAKELEDYHGVTPDAALVEILDCASSYVWTTHSNAVRAWAAATNWTPRRAVGDRFDTRHGVGAITRICSDNAYYLFVPDAEVSRFTNGGIIITDEELDASQALEGAA